MADTLTDSMHSNDSSCPGFYCVEATLYRKIVGTTIFIIIWPFIVLDIKIFPLGRPAAALLGATLMVLFVVVPQDQVYAILGEKGNLQTLCLLVGMMLMSYYYDREGILQRIALWIFGNKKPFKTILWKVCVFSAILSAVITNDATCLVITPLLLKEHMKQGRSEKELTPLLLGIATSANIGSAATFFGNPQNAFIAANSEGGVSLLIFFATSLPAAMIGLGLSLGLLYLFYIRRTCMKQEDLLTPLEPSTNTETAVTNEVLSVCSSQEKQTLAESRQEMALSYDRSANPQLTCQMAKERESLYSNEHRISNSLSTNAKTCYYYFDVKFQHGGEDSVTFSNSLQQDQTPQPVGTSYEYGALQTSGESGVPSGRKSRLRRRSNESSIAESSFTTAIENPAKESLIQELPDQEEGDPEKTKSITSQPETQPKATWRKKAFITWLVVITSILIILLAIPPPPILSVEFNLGLVPIGAGVLTMFVDTILNRKYPFDAIQKVDWNVIMMFIGLFVWLGGFENTRFPADTFSGIKPHMDLSTVGGVLLFSVFVIVGSNVLSNVPLVILVVDQLFAFKCGDDTYCTAQLTGMILAWVSTIAGNFTLIGSVANLIVAEKARCVVNYRLTFWEYLKFGFCSTMVVLFVGLPIVYFTSKNIHI